MSFRSWFAHLQVARTVDRLTRERRRSPRRRRASPFCFHAEVLEARTLLSAYTAASASALIADINAANQAGGANFIKLTAEVDLTAVNNSTNGANGLPVISGKHQADNLTIWGSGIDRSTAAGTPAFRLFDVAKGNSLILYYPRLQGGLAEGQGAAADGGAIYNQGMLYLIGVTVEGNTAQGAAGMPVKGGKPGSDAAGGGIWSNGGLDLEGGVISGNSAMGGDAGVKTSGAAPGGNAFGGGICVAGGAASIENTTFGFYVDPFGSIRGGGNTAEGGIGINASGGSAYGGAVYFAGGRLQMFEDRTDPIGYNPGFENLENVAVGGLGGGLAGKHGIAYGGALYVASGTAQLRDDVITENSAGDYEDIIGLTNGYGGGIFIAPAARVLLSSTTLNNTILNVDSSSFSQGGIGDGSTANIDGTFVYVL